MLFTKSTNGVNMNSEEFVSRNNQYYLLNMGYVMKDKSPIHIYDRFMVFSYFRNANKFLPQNKTRGKLCAVYLVFIIDAVFRHR